MSKVFRFIDSDELAIVLIILWLGLAAKSLYDTHYYVASLQILLAVHNAVEISYAKKVRELRTIVIR